jgi:cytochrome c556
LAPAEIERDIEQKRALFVSFAQALQVTAQRTLEAIDHKDTDAVMTTGGDIDVACEACHVVFWYPHQR